MPATDLSSLCVANTPWAKIIVLTGWPAASPFPIDCEYDKQYTGG